MYKNDFPIFQHRPDLIYFDNGASSQRCKKALDAVMDFYLKSNSNIHRGPHFLAEEATIKYEEARRTVADFLGAQNSEEIIFTRNATEAINLVAYTFGETLKQGDVIVTTELEHHANLVPWLHLKKRKGVEIRYIPFNKEGYLEFDPAIIDEKVKLVAVSGMSNVLGTITDLKPIIKKAHEMNAKVLVDGAQLTVHQPVNVHLMDVDFFVFTGHKLYGPTGIGVLYGKRELLEKLPPFLTGGDMVQSVSKDGFIPADLPEKFEAGTPNIAGAIGLKGAIDYVLSVGWKTIQKREHELTDHLLNKVREMDFIKIIGPTQKIKKSLKALDARKSQNLNRNSLTINEDLNFEHDNADDSFKDFYRGSIFSFIMEGVHPHDIAEGLSSKNICIRAGQHCAQPLVEKFGLTATARMSLAFYNTKEEIDKAMEALEEIYNYFK